jgi:thiamine pyrophosphate-dependent acetolactate synthase large subunit-like protein
VKLLIRQYLDRGISRRGFLSGLGALGITASAASAMASSLDPFLPQAQQVSPGGPEPSWMRQMRGTGGALMVAQLKAGGIEYVFFNPSTGTAPIFDALVDEPQIHVIHTLQEGAAVAMADGYAKASGKTPFVTCARPGFPNAMTQIFNTWKDQIPMLIAVDYASRQTLGEDTFQEADHMEIMAQPITKWYWVATTAGTIPEITRRAMKFASTAPCAPVFLALPEDTLAEETTASVMDQSKFDVSTKMRPDSAQIEQVARLLLEAKNPLLYVGDELTRCGAQKEVVELAELLGLPVARNTEANMGWSKPFPTRHPLFIGNYVRETRYPGPADVMLDLGSRLPYGYAFDPNEKLIQIRLDPSNLARFAPTELALVADLKLAIVDLMAAVRSMATAARLKQISDDRTAKTADYTAKMREFRESIARSEAGQSSISHVALGLELENVLEKDACFVADLDSGKTMESVMSFGGADKQFFGTTGAALGWGLPAALGVKLAQPDLQVVSVMGDGSFLFSGPQPLWSFARYNVPAIIIVGNNRSYNNERVRIWNAGGKQFQKGKDMMCYLGDPDVDYAKTAAAFGVEGEVVVESSGLRPALERAKRATADGRPYLLDVHIDREGAGASSMWHSPYSVASLRQRKV